MHQALRNIQISSYGSYSYRGAVFCLNKHRERASWTFVTPEGEQYGQSVVCHVGDELASLDALLLNFERSMEYKNIQLPDATEMVYVANPFWGLMFDIDGGGKNPNYLRVE